jgi:hypothetical protein
MSWAGPASSMYPPGYGRRPSRLWPRLVQTIAMLDIAAAAVLIGLALANHNSPAAGGRAPGRTPAASPLTAGRPAPSTSTPSTAPPAGPRPALQSISPGTGRPGQVVVLHGTGFYSADRLITVVFGPAQAPVRCPSRTTCLSTVPGQPGTPGPTRARVPVMITTQTGTSNRLFFTYS